MILRITLATFSIVAWVSSLEVPHIGSLSLSTHLECPHPRSVLTLLFQIQVKVCGFVEEILGREIPELTLGL